MNNLYIIGDGKFADQVKSIASQLKRWKKIFIVSQQSETNHDRSIISENDFISYENSIKDSNDIFIGLGYLHSQKKIQLISEYQRKGFKLVNIIHQTTLIEKSSDLGINIVTYPNSYVDHNVTIEDGVTLNIGTIIAHDTVIEKGSFIAPGCVISGNCRISEYCFVGSNSTLANNITIGKSCTIGAGSVLYKDIPNYKKIVNDHKIRVLNQN